METEAFVSCAMQCWAQDGGCPEGVVRWCGLHVSTLQIYIEEVSLPTVVNAKIGLIWIYLAIMRVHYLKDVCFYAGV